MENKSFPSWVYLTVLSFFHVFLRYGPPVECAQCGIKAAFVRPQEKLDEVWFILLVRSSTLSILFLNISSLFYCHLNRLVESRYV